MEETNITQIIIDTINTILGNLFSSIDNNLYSLLDDITFISSDILNDKNFENIFGTSTSNGILLIANSLLLGIILYFALRYLLSHFTYSQIESPHSFLIKLIICGICMNFSYFLLSQFLDLFSNISESYNSYYQTDYIYDTNFFTRQLETFTALTFLSDGNRIYEPKKIQMLPYFKK